MAYGREVLTPACSTPEDRSLLEDALALFAYEGEMRGSDGDQMHTCTASRDT